MNLRAVSGTIKVSYKNQAKIVTINVEVVLAPGLDLRARNGEYV